MNTTDVREFQNFIAELLKNESDVICHQILGCSFSIIKSCLQDHKLPDINNITKLRFPVLLVHKPVADPAYSAPINSDKNLDIQRRRSAKSSSGSVSSECGLKLKNTDQDSFDHSGSPLKLQAYADLSAFDSPSQNDVQSPCYVSKATPTEKPVGLPVKKARYILSLFTMALTNNTDKPLQLLPAILVLCDGNDIKGTACIYLEPQIDEKTTSMMGVKSSMVTLQESKAGKLPKIQELEKHSFDGKEIKFQARYNVFTAMENKQIAGYQGSLMVESEWSRMSHVTLLQQPPLNSRTTLIAKVSSGDVNSAAIGLFQELSILKSLVKGLETNEVVWVAEPSDKPLLEMVKELIEKLKLGDALVEEKKEKQSESEGDIQPGTFSNMSFSDRKDLDFTDHLWQILLHCTVYADLVDCLQHVFTVLSNGELQPRINRHNHTTMAEMVRESYVGKLRVPALTGLFPLEILAEMGAEKLRQDYLSAFLSNEMTTHGLDVFIRQDLSLAEKPEYFERLHNVMEMMIMLNMFLHIPHATLSTTAHQMIKHYEVHSVDSDHIFTFQVPTSTISRVLDSSAPSEWRFKVEKTVEGHLGVTETVAYCFTSKQPFSHLPVKDAFQEVLNDTGAGDSTFYYAIKSKDSVSILT